MDFDSDSLSTALTRARVAAEKHMTKFECAGWAWKEETVTDIVLSEATPRMTAYPFSRNEEGGKGGKGGTGADWLWWWIDRDGTAFGMFVRAKRLKKKITKAALHGSWGSGLVS